MGIDISPVASRMLEAMDKYIEESSKKEYRFTYEEQMKIIRMINVLNKHLDILIDYEIKRKEEK